MTFFKEVKASIFSWKSLPVQYDVHFENYGPIWGQIDDTSGQDKKRGTNNEDTQLKTF